ncbi:hypothetical protein LIER_40907 [Lithospermum erythrorhizon]|uniref:DNA helicase Pif1-like 2B domain-containing protein n=1 Tax=Lithospermum erythrorhizon TaxID=34254 RepID=A0AAV3R1J6_LITER
MTDKAVVVALNALLQDLCHSQQPFGGKLVVFGDMSLFEVRPFEMMQRIILCPKNDFVDDINSKLIQRISGQEMICVSNDCAKNGFDQGDYVDYLNSLEPRGLPEHRLVLKLNCPVILLRNINPIEVLVKASLT